MSFFSYGALTLMCSSSTNYNLIITYVYLCKDLNVNWKLLETVIGVDGRHKIERASMFQLTNVK